MSALYSNQTTGRDHTFVLVLPPVGILNPGGVIISVDPKPLDKDLVTHGMDGTIYFGVIPAGWEGTFTVERFTPELDQYWAAMEAAYYAGVQVAPGYIEEYIQEAGGNVSQFRYENVAFRLSDLGSIKGDDKQTMKATFKASKRSQIA